MQSPITISMWPGNKAAGGTAGHVATMTGANAGSRSAGPSARDLELHAAAGDGEAISRA